MLDTETISSFSGGVYLQWEVSGNVVVKVTNLGGLNALINGIFLDAPSVPSTPSTAVASVASRYLAMQANGIGAGFYHRASQPTPGSKKPLV